MNFLEEFICRTRIAIDQLESKKNEIEKHHKKCNITRTIGTGVSTTGAGLVLGGLLLAPFTAGTSLIAATGLGAAMGLGGAAVSLSTEAVDFFASKSFTKQIKEIFEERNKIGEKLKECFDQIEAISYILIEDGMNDEDATANALFLIFKKNMTFEDFLKARNSEQLAAGFKLPFRTENEQFLNSFKQSRDIKEIMGNLGIKVGKNAAIHIIKSGSIILSTVFVFFDIKSLVKSWKSQHPTINQIEELIKNMNNQLYHLCSLDEWLKEIPDNVNPI